MRCTAPLLLAVALLLPWAQPATAGPDWESEEGYKRLLRGEAKTLAPLVEAALKADYRRQAWYLADRLISCDPDSTIAANVLEMWDGSKLQRGELPKQAFLSKMAGALQKIGNAYFNFGETLEAAGIDPIDYYPINVRAQSYGSVAGPLIASMKSGGFMWLGTYGHEEEADVRKLLGSDLLSTTTYPPEWDDDFLKIRVNWPEARVLECPGWRLITDHKYDQALRALKTLVDVERWAIKRMGKGSPRKGRTTVVFFRDRATYEKLGRSMVRTRYSDAFAANTGYFVDTYSRAFVADVDEKNTWVGTYQNLQGMALRALARSRYAKGVETRVGGVGEWLLEGLRGVGEALVYTDRTSGDMALEPKGCWRLAAARAMRDGQTAIPWLDLFATNESRRLSTERIESLEIHVNGAKFTAQGVDSVAAQGATYAIAVLMSHRKRGGKALAKLLVKLAKEGSLTTPWKPLGWKPAKLREELDRAMDAIVVAK